MPAQPLTTEQLEDAARLKQLFLAWQSRRKEAGLPSSQEAVSELLGFNQSSMSQYLNGKIPLNVGAATKFAAVLECSIGDFSPALASHAVAIAAVAAPGATGTDSTPPFPGAMRVKAGEEEDTVAIKRVNAVLRAGIMRLEPDHDLSFGPDLRIPRRVLEQLRLDPANLVAMKVKGMSMEPMMFEDDLIVIDISDKRPINRELYAINFDRDACVKQLLSRGGQWYLHSINPDFKPVNVKSGDLNIIGRVVYQPGRVVTGRL